LGNLISHEHRIHQHNISSALHQLKISSNQRAPAQAPHPNDSREIMINSHLLEDRMLGIEVRQDLVDMLLVVLIKQGFHLIISQQSYIR
jgi:hypothetical protein